MRRPLAASVFALCAFAVSASAQNVTVVQSQGPGPWGNARLVQELRIGELEGAEEYSLGFVLDVAVGRDGSIFVAEGRPTGLRMFDARGKFVKGSAAKEAARANTGRSTRSSSWPTATSRCVMATCGV